MDAADDNDAATMREKNFGGKLSRNQHLWNKIEGGIHVVHLCGGPVSSYLITQSQSSVMDKILEIAESTDSEYPQHFQAFLDHCLKKFGRNFLANDYLFAAVFFLVLETGFNPVDLPVDLSECQSENFDIRKLRLVKSYFNGQIKASKHVDGSECQIYQIKLRLGKFDSNECELQGVPSAEANTHLIINFFSKEPYVIRSVCLSTQEYTKSRERPKGHKCVLKNLQDLSIIVKNELAVYLKDLILTNEKEGCSSNLLCLPEVVQKKIVYSMIDEPESIQCLSSTCSYFYNFISNDANLWEKICFHNYTSTALNKVLVDMSVLSDSNVFKRAYLELKMDDYKRSRVVAELAHMYDDYNE